MISGIELIANGQKVAWSIADYLAALDKGVDELLKEKDKPETKVEPKPEVKAEPKPEPKGGQTPEAKVELKPEVKVGPKPEAKSQ